MTAQKHNFKRAMTNQRIYKFCALLQDNFKTTANIEFFFFKGQ